MRSVKLKSRVEIVVFFPEADKTNLQSSGESYEMEFTKDADMKPPRGS